MKKARKRKLIKEIEHVLDNYSFLGYGDEVEVVLVADIRYTLKDFKKGKK